jgi:acetyl-CoA acyltransferase
LFESYPEVYEGMGITAENVAKKYAISRNDQDLFAVRSHEKADFAIQKGRLVDEIVPIISGDVVISEDGCPRPGTSQEALAGLPSIFIQKGSVTAGTSSPLTDGAAAVLVTSRAFAEKHDLPILCSIRSIAVAGCAPEIMGIGPVDATHKALQRASLIIDDIDVIELNEAFSSQSLACIRELGMNEARINLDGGAIALGHPLGATGARIVGKAASLLAREGKKFALATQCIGGGQGIATILEAE